MAQASKPACNHNPPKEVEEECTSGSARDQHGKENNWDYEGNKGCNAIKTGEAAVESDATALSASRPPAPTSTETANNLFAIPVVARRGA